MMNNQIEKTKRNYYEILDIKPGCNHNEILHAYNRAKEAFSAGSLASYSLFEEEDNQRALVEVEEAYAILGHPAKRREYDLSQGFETWEAEGGQNKKKKQANADSPRLSLAPGSVTSSFQELSADSGLETESLQSLEVVSGVSDSNKSAVAQSLTAGGQYQPNAEFEQQIENCQELSGDFLRAVRIFRRLTVDQVASACKLSHRVVEKIEQEDIAEFQYQPVYLRGHVYMLCQALDIPRPLELAKAFVERMRAEGKLNLNQF